MKTAASIVVVLVCPVVALAGWPFGKKCRVEECPPPQCEPVQHCPPPCPRKVVVIEEVEGERAAPRAAPPAGRFVQPPPIGERAGGSTALGIRGFRIRFPEMTFELPTIQLPSLVLLKRGPEFRSDHTRAPYMEGPVVGYSMTGFQDRAAPPAPRAAPPAPTTKEAPKKPQCEGDKCTLPDCAQHSAAKTQIQLQQQQIALLAKQVAQLQQMLERRKIEEASTSESPATQTTQTGRETLAPETPSRPESDSGKYDIHYAPQRAQAAEDVRLISAPPASEPPAKMYQRLTFWRK